MAHTDDVGSRIRQRRQELGWTQAELAARVGVAEATVMRWELGRNSPRRHQGRLEAVLEIRLNGEKYTDPNEQKLKAAGLPPATFRILLAAYRREAMRRSA